MEPFAVPGLRRHAERLRASYSRAAPFPHAVIDDLFPAGVIQAIASEVPEQMLPSGCVPGAAACYRKASVHFRKSELHHESMGPSTRRLFVTLRSAPFVRFLETLSGVEGLIPDPGYEGSGVHLTGDGGVLAVHHDFNYMLCDVASGVYSGCGRPNPHAAATAQRVQLHRRVNVFVYLNHDWPDAYGGHLELWARNMSRCEARIRPALGRFAVFSSTDFSFHGHPTPLRLPPGRMRSEREETPGELGPAYRKETASKTTSRCSRGQELATARRSAAPGTSTTSTAVSSSSAIFSTSVSDWVSWR